MYHTTREIEEKKNPKDKEKRTFTSTYIERETQERLAVIIACWHCV
jgi:hypothetical protein